MSSKDTSIKITQLVEAGFLTRTSYDIYGGVARTYGMPDELRTEGWKIINEKIIDETLF